MLFAHAPAGFLLSYAFKKRWSPNLNKKQIIIAVIFGVIGSLFPDVDLFFYYLFSATFSHHEIFTHGIFFYVVIFLFFYLLSRLLAKPVLKIYGTLFFLGVASHLLVDSLGAGVVWLYPFSKQLFGLLSLEFYRASWLGQNFFVVNFGLETIICFAWLFFLIKKLVKQKKYQYFGYGLSLFFGISSLAMIFTMNSHLFHNSSDMYFSDLDKDGIINKYDLDIDNDGLLNIDDQDIDNNGETNRQVLLKQTHNLTGIWYDKTEGGLIEIPLRLGLVTNTDFVERIFSNAGIFLRTEMGEDYKINPEGYRVSPKEKSFERTAANWQAFLNHKNKLLAAKTTIKDYDILFFQNGFVALALPKEKNNQPVLTADPEIKRVIKLDLNSLMEQKGEILSIGRLIE